LHRALAERRRVADDERAAVVLQRTGDDLRGRGAEAAREHDERAVVDHRGIGIAPDVDIAARAAGLYHGPLRDEQTGQVDRLLQRSATVAPQIQDHALHILGAELLEQPRDVLGRAGRGRRAAIVGAAAAAHVGIERRQLDDPEPQRLAAIVRLIDDPRLGPAFLELDLIAHELDGLALRGVAGTDRNDRQFHGRALRAADELHRLRQR
jgi:hypothetical protein